MFEVLKKMLHQPENVIQTIPWLSLPVILTGIFLLVISVLAIKKLLKKKNRILAIVYVISTLIVFYHFRPVYFEHLKIFLISLIQQSFIVLEPIIGNADFLGENAYRALILRYSLIIGAVFTAISTIFVYFLPKENKK